MCRRASRSHEACLSRAMPPFEPTISHFIFKLEQSVLMCCTCVCPGQRMTQIHTMRRAVKRHAHGTWHMAHGDIGLSGWIQLSGVNRSIVMPNTCRKECPRSKKESYVRRERFEVLMKIEVCVVRRYRYGFRWFCFSRGPCAVGGTVRAPLDRHLRLEAAARAGRAACSLSLGIVPGGQRPGRRAPGLRHESETE